MDEQEKELQSLKDTVGAMKLEREQDRLVMNQLKFDVVKGRVHSIYNEQYSRRKSIRIIGLTGDRGVPITAETCLPTVIDFIKTKLAINITPGDIEATHPVKTRGQKSSTLVKFYSKQKMVDVLKVRKTLMDSGVGIMEDLCTDLVGLMKDLRQNPDTEQVWSSFGKMYRKNRRGVVSVVTVTEYLANNYNF